MLKEKKITLIFNSGALLLFFILVIESFLRTGNNSENLMNEYIYFSSDSLLRNILRVGIILLVFFVLGILYDRYRKEISIHRIRGIVCLISLIVSIYWIGASNTAPWADQQNICDYAVAFNQGDFTGLQKGGYVASCPQQLGLITLMRIFFWFFGNGNFRPFQYFSALMVPVIILAGSMIVRKLSQENELAELFYLFLIILCLPLYGYVPFVYGEICSTAFILLATWMFLSCLDFFNWRKVIMLGGMIGIAVQMRQNALIMVIAFLIVIVVKLISGKRERYVWATGISVIFGVLLFQFIIKGIYFDVMPKDSKAMPAVLYVTMGTNYENDNAGWYNSYNFSTFEKNNYEVKLSQEEAKKDLWLFIEKCMNNPRYVADFYYNKIMSQWNAPMYQCLAMNNNIIGPQSKLAGSIYSGSLRSKIEAFMNIYQLLIYSGVLWMLFMVRKEWCKIEKYVFLICIVGGFLFSIIWEAKTRYVFPYFIMMIPYAAIGIQILVNKMFKYKGKNK